MEDTEIKGVLAKTLSRDFSKQKLNDAQDILGDMEYEFKLLGMTDRGNQCDYLFGLLADITASMN